MTGAYTVVASFDNYVSAPFELTNTTVGVVSSLSVTAGNGQSAQIGDAFPDPLSVQVADEYGDPVAGTTVNFAVVSTAGAGATFAGAGSSAAVQTNERRRRRQPDAHGRDHRRRLHRDRHRGRGSARWPPFRSPTWPAWPLTSPPGWGRPRALRRGTTSPCPWR